MKKKEKQKHLSNCVINGARPNTLILMWRELIKHTHHRLMVNSDHWSKSESFQPLHVPTWTLKSKMLGLTRTAKNETWHGESSLKRLKFVLRDKIPEVLEISTAIAMLYILYTHCVLISLSQFLWKIIVEVYHVKDIHFYQDI